MYSIKSSTLCFVYLNSVRFWFNHHSIVAIWKLIKCKLKVSLSLTFTVNVVFQLFVWVCFKTDTHTLFTFVLWLFRFSIVCVWVYCVHVCVYLLSWHTVCWFSSGQDCLISGLKPSSTWSSKYTLQIWAQLKRLGQRKREGVTKTVKQGTFWVFYCTLTSVERVNDSFFQEINVNTFLLWGVLIQKRETHVKLHYYYLHMLNNNNLLKMTYKTFHAPQAALLHSFPDV